LTDPQFSDVARVIRQIRAAGKTTYYIAKLMRCQVVQIQRMEKTGRCQPHEWAMLLEILKDVSECPLNANTCVLPRF
jgi:predicted transcriptional regulator